MGVTINFIKVKSEFNCLIFNFYKFADSFFGLFLAFSMHIKIQFNVFLIEFDIHLH